MTNKTNIYTNTLNEIVKFLKTSQLNEAGALTNELLQKANSFVIALDYAAALPIFKGYIDYLSNNIDYIHHNHDYLNNNVDVLNNLATCYQKTNDFEPAINTFIKTLLIKPNNAVAHQTISSILNNNRIDLPSQISIYKQLVKIPSFFDYGPIRIRLETSSICNLKCQHCPTGTHYDLIDRSVMSMELFEIILKQLQQLPLLESCVLYLGGEPLLNKHLSLMSQRLKKETTIKWIILTTNGMLITPTICEQLAHANIDQIRISIDGRSANENDQVRQGSDYQTVKKNVYLLKHFLKTTELIIANTIIKQNEDEITNPIPPSFLLEDFPEFPIETTYAMKWPGFELNHSKIKKMALHKIKPQNFCRAPFHELSIRANGDMVLCCYDLLSGKITGKVTTDSILTIWKNPFYMALRKTILDQTVNDLPVMCQDCISYNEEGYLAV